MFNLLFYLDSTPTFFAWQRLPIFNKNLDNQVLAKTASMNAMRTENEYIDQ